MVKERSKKASSAKSSSAPLFNVPSQENTPTIDEPSFSPPNVIRVEAVGYENIKTTYPVSDLTIKFEFEGVTVYESPKTYVLSFDLIDTDFDFEMPCDLSNPKDRERFISSPMIVTVYESERIVDMSEVEILTPGLFENTPSIPEITEEPTPSKTKKSKNKLSDKKSKKSESNKKNKASDKASSKKSSSKVASLSDIPQKPSGPIKLGVAKLDLLPLFLGYSFFSESLYIESRPPVFDQTATALQNLPKVKVCVTLLGPAVSEDTTTILHITVESLYNIPSMIASDFQYELCCLLPGETLKLEPIVFNKGRLVNENQKFLYKLWPRVSEEHVPIPSTYRLPDDLKDVRKFVNIDIDPIVSGRSPRVEWNIIKRQFLTVDSLANLHHQISKYRKIPIEIYVTPPKEPVVEQPPEESKKKGSPAKGGKNDKMAKSKTSVKSQPEIVSGKDFDSTVDYLHMIALVDIGYLLYPGVNKCRVACPLRTYQEVEVLGQVGLEDSYFRPKPPPRPPSPDKEPDEKKSDKKGGGKNKTGKASKGEAKTSSKSSKTKKDKGSKKDKGGTKEKGTPVEGTNLAEFLPLPPPPPPPPSKKILNDDGKPAFIILEFEFLRPLVQKRTLESLEEDMDKFLPKRPDLPKKFISAKVADGIYGETIRAVLTDINLQYRTYLEEKKNCRCDLDSFQSYLQQTGGYPTYLTTIIRTLSVMVPQKYDYKRSMFTSARDYQIFVAKIYVDIVQEMNRVVNEQNVCYRGYEEHKHYVKNDKILLYAKEAIELGEEDCAERYFLERICCREDDPDCWFDYAVFLTEINNYEKAVECVTEVVQINSVHKYGLMMYGLILSDKNKTMESETCLLRMICLNPSWSEGWIVFYSFYKRIGNLEGAEYTLDMAKKCFSESKEGPKDYFNSTDDLAWSSEKLQDDVFLRTAALLIKMRLYEHAERVMSYTLFTQKGLCKYLFGVIAYLKNDFSKSLEHLRKAEKLIGWNHGISSLLGHCNTKLHNYEAALRQYEMVLGMYNRPEDIHLVFMNAAMAYDIAGESQKARQLALLACKLSPTPYSWLFAGGFYYKQNDLLSAEECLIQSNLCDNRLAEPWAYLALINLEFGRKHECELCLTQAKKFNVDDKPLVKNIEIMIIKQRKRDSKKH